MGDQEIQEVEKTKRFLKRYRKNVACVARLESKLASLVHRIESIKSPNLSGMPRGGTPVTIDDLLSDKMDLEDRISRLKKKKHGLKKSILDEIDSLEDPTLCEILEAYFIDCESLEDIADKEGYTVRHVYRLYSEGVRQITVSRQQDGITL